MTLSEREIEEKTHPPGITAELRLRATVIDQPQKNDNGPLATLKEESKDQLPRSLDEALDRLQARTGLKLKKEEPIPIEDEPSRNNRDAKFLEMIFAVILIVGALALLVGSLLGWIRPE